MERPILLDDWPRREHYELFCKYGLPFFAITSSVDVAPLRKALKERRTSFTVGLLYVLARAANAVPAFRQRVREHGPIEHDVVHPGVTVLCEGDVFHFGILRYMESFKRFAKDAAEIIEAARIAPCLGDVPPEDDLLYCTALPWFSFSDMFHPLLLDPTDSVPRIAWGRFEEQDGCLAMPLNVQAHHALVDGIHVAHFLDKVQEGIREFESIIGASP